MQDHEFEKQVHQKMEEIKILPSDAVWKEVEKRLHTKSESRRWIWFLFLLFTLSIGGYLIHTHNPASNESLQPGRDLLFHNGNVIKRNKDKTKPEEEVKSKTTEYKKRDTREITALPIARKDRYLSGKDKQLTTSLQLSVPASATHASIHANPTGKPETGNLKGAVIVKSAVNIRHLQKSESFSSASSAHKPNDSSGNMMITKEPVPSRVNSSISSSYPVNTSRALQNLGVAVNAPVQKKQKRSGWEWGLSVRGGRSGITNGNFTSLFARESVADMFSSPTFSNQSVSPSATTTLPSALKPGFGFSTGVLVSKQLTRRTSLSAGLQYTRFSTSHKVGKQVTDSLVILRSGNSADQKSIEEYFRVGNTDSYVNKYHFIELPLLFETRLTGNRFVPVYWDIGLFFSRLITSNALHFNGNARIYYKNNSLFDRNQFSFITGVPVRILSEDRFSLKAGPLFQYNMSNLINRRGSSRHLLFIGVKADITLFK